MRIRAGKDWYPFTGMDGWLRIQIRTDINRFDAKFCPPVTHAAGHLPVKSQGVVSGSHPQNKTRLLFSAITG
jgi:hypothetical protein